MRDNESDKSPHVIADMESHRTERQGILRRTYALILDESDRSPLLVASKEGWKLPHSDEVLHNVDIKEGLVADRDGEKSRCDAFCSLLLDHYNMKLPSLTLLHKA